MPQVELTDRFCQAAKAGDSRKADYFDTVVKGLCLRSSAGGAKAFYLVYTRPADGGRTWLRLGRYPDITLARAREKAREARGGIGEGIDPLVEKRARAASQTVTDLVENYVARHAMTKRTGPAIARRLNFNVKPAIGSVKLSELHRRDITKCVDIVKDRGAHTEANRLFEDIRAMVRWARARGDLDVNLVEGMRKPSETVERDRVLDADEIRTMWSALPDADMREATRRVIRLCLISAQRVGEVCGMTRGEIDLDRRLWTIPASRSKNGRAHEVPLSDMAVDIIREQLAAAEAQARRKGRPPSDCIFPAPRGSKASMAGAAAAKAVKKAEVEKDGVATILGVAPFTPHDLRRSAATGMARLSVSPYIVAHVLGHISVTKASVTAKHYDHYDYSAEKRRALDLWADRLAAILEGGADIVPLSGVAR